MTVPGLELTQFAVTEPAPGYWRATFDHPPTNLMNAVTAAELRAIVEAAASTPTPFPRSLVIGFTALATARIPCRKVLGQLVHKYERAHDVYLANPNVAGQSR